MNYFLNTSAKTTVVFLRRRSRRYGWENVFFVTLQNIRKDRQRVFVRWAAHCREGILITELVREYGRHNL